MSKFTRLLMISVMMSGLAAELPAWGSVPAQANVDACVLRNLGVMKKKFPKENPGSAVSNSLRGICKSNPNFVLTDAEVENALHGKVTPPPPPPPPSPKNANAQKIAKDKSELATLQGQLKQEEGVNINREIQNDAAYKSFMDQSRKAISPAEAKRLGNLPGGEAYKRAEAIKAQHEENITRLKNEISSLEAEINKLSK